MLLNGSVSRTEMFASVTVKIKLPNRGSSNRRLHYVSSRLVLERLASSLRCYPFSASQNVD